MASLEIEGCSGLLCLHRPTQQLLIPGWLLTILVQARLALGPNPSQYVPGISVSNRAGVSTHGAPLRVELGEVRHQP